jgi:hypothetical protein
MHTVSLPGAVAGLRGTGAADHSPRDTGERPHMTGTFVTSYKVLYRVQMPLSAKKVVDSQDCNDELIKNLNVRRY